MSLFLNFSSLNFYQYFDFLSEETQLQCVPDHFESVDEYVRVFEPLLFEECRAQLFSSWEELAETNSKDTSVMVKIKYVERRERGIELLITGIWLCLFAMSVCIKL